MEVVSEEERIKEYDRQHEQAKRSLKGKNSSGAKELAAGYTKGGAQIIRIHARVLIKSVCLTVIPVFMGLRVFRGRTCTCISEVVCRSSVCV